MPVLIFIDQSEGHIKKAAAETLSYGAQLAAQAGTVAEGVVLGSVKDDLPALGQYGIDKIHHISDPQLDHIDAQVFTGIIAQVVQATGAKIVIFPNNADGKAIAPRLCARLKAALVTGAVALPDTTNGFVVKKSVFSGKAFAHVALHTDVKIITLNANAFPVAASTDAKAAIIPFNATIDATKVKVISVNKVKGEVPLSEAEIVVSGGRGLKGPENWGMIEALAKLLGAATACSRPVADTHWRPHHEHVGQTGLAIAPNLYIAIGISGAIQHLAGVNRSKTIVVINKDPEAPFFKAADYGIVGDAFEVVPKLIEEVKKLKGVA
ncbi:MAG TPA: electron transfer flavoprotein subunit alpha/FixB family protein [Agriterribacter sp.]|nr:electron transfer flavoprotein subunit alpha/FixB family protein [Agriterribacter sp.]HRQ51860.1 electron transfer flavoprotein subunit alpha/FixB family protein [Agriterribacter sp.]